MCLLVLVFSAVGYGIVRLYRYYVNQQRSGLLDQPLDLLDDFKKKDETGEPEPVETAANRTRYTKAQARQRFKRGKT